VGIINSLINRRGNPPPTKGVYNMSRKHFETIAGTLKFNRAEKSLCLELAMKFMDFNPNFDIDKFMTACGH
jgi:hypothetical protein